MKENYNTGENVYQTYELSSNLMDKSMTVILCWVSFRLNHIERNYRGFLFSFEIGDWYYSATVSLKCEILSISFRVGLLTKIWGEKLARLLVFIKSVLWTLNFEFLSRYFIPCLSDLLSTYLSKSFNLSPYAKWILEIVRYLLEGQATNLTKQPTYCTLLSPSVLNSTLSVLSCLLSLSCPVILAHGSWLFVCSWVNEYRKLFAHNPVWRLGLNTWFIQNPQQCWSLFQNCLTVVMRNEGKR